MRLKLLSFFLFPLLAFASPVRSNMGGSEIGDADFAPPENLWVWPSEMVEPPKTLNPQYIWTPQPFVYYGFIASNGYCQKGRNPLGTFTEDSFTSRFSSGYSLGVFVPLTPGEYRLSYECDGRNYATIASYKEAQGGFLYGALIFSVFRSEGHTVVEFALPEDCGLALLQIKPLNASDPPTTVNSIEIYRLD